MELYFDKYPNVSYNGFMAKNITLNSKIYDRFFSAPYIFYDYVVNDGERADQIANRIYGDPNYAWLIYMCNKIVDPYYGWLLPYNQFLTFIKSKYRSIENAQNKIKYFRNNWYNDSRVLDGASYGALSSNLKKYWTTKYDSSGILIGYVRREIDWLQNTNVIVEYTCANSSFSFEKDEVINCLNGQIFSGRCQYVSKNNNKLIAQHVIDGEFAPVNLVSDKNGNSISASGFRVLNRNIPLSDSAYWEAVSFYDYEEEENEKKRYIRLINPAYAYSIADQLRRLLEENVFE